MTSSFLSEHFLKLKYDLALLTSKLAHIPAQYAAVAVIPPVSKESENAPVTEIQINIQTGLQAQTLAAQCYQDISIKPGLSQKAARRTLGVLWYSPALTPDAATIIDLVKRINTTKAEIETHVTTHYLDRKERFEAMHSAAPGVMTIHLYRQIKYFDSGDVSSIRFTWKQKELVQKLDKSALLNRIETELARTGEDYRTPLELLLGHIRKTDGDLLRERRPVKVQPFANIIERANTHAINSPMPLILFQKDAAAIKMPNSFSADIARKTRSDRAQSFILGSFGGVQIEAVAKD